MLRPSDFVRPYRTATVTPYQMIAGPTETPERGSSNGGVFHRGQLVWTREIPLPVSVPHTTIGYVDGLGHVLIDRRTLRLTELTSHKQN